jgi:hypothetical protein
MWTLGTPALHLALILLAAGVLQRGDRRHEAVEASSPTLAV